MRRPAWAGLALTALAALVTPLAAQGPALGLDVSLGLKGGAQRASLGIWPGIARRAGPVRVGLGLRATAYAGDSAPYANRDAVTGSRPATLAIDPGVYGLAAAVSAELRVAAAVAVGMNLDVIGVAGGAKRTSGALSATPQSFSYFRYGSADHGALNSEFFVALRLAPRLRLRAGLSHYVTDYEVTDPATPGSAASRYQRFETVPFVALAWR